MPPPSRDGTSANEIDVREAIAEAPVGPFHRLIVALIGLIVFFEGYDTFNAAYVIHYVSGPWKLTASEAGVLVSSGMVGFAIGSLLHGRLSDRYGRRTVLIGALWIVSGCSFATAALGHTYLLFCLSRVATGVGLGVLLPTGVTFLNEYAPRRLKGTFATWGWNLGFSLGGVVASVVGVYLTPKYGWEVLYYIASVSVVLTLICHRVLPESLQFLALQNRQPQVAALLTRLDPQRQQLYQDPRARFVLPEDGSAAGSLKRLLRPENRRNTLALWATAFFVLFAIYGLTSWVPNVMIARTGSFTTSFALGAVMLIMNFLGTLAFSYCADRLQKPQWVLIVWWLAGAAAVGLLTITTGALTSTMVVAAAGFFVLGGQGGLNNLTATWHDTAVRGSAVGLMLGMGRVGGIIGPYVTGWIQQVRPGAGALFGAIAVAVLLAAAAIRLVRPNRIY